MNTTDTDNVKVTVGVDLDALDRALAWLDGPTSTDTDDGLSAWLTLRQLVTAARFSAQVMRGDQCSNVI
jgi:hypothetical protein